MSGYVKLCAVPINLDEAHAFVDRIHRHHESSPGGKFAIGCAVDGEIVGVAVVGRPPGRMSDNGWTAEVTRLATDGTRNACSFLYRRCWDAARAMGYTKIITYTLAEEGGASLRAAGFRTLGEAGGGTWSRESRPRVDKHPTQIKIKWELVAIQGG